ncbi:MAG: hypothetical protein AAF799_14365 [Myxococcota bacterium]
MSAEQYLVPRLPFAEREALRKLLFECIDALDELGFEFVESAHDESDTTRRTRFSDEPETSHIELWEDYLGRVRYLRLESSDAAELGRLVEVFERLIPAESHEALCASAADSSDPSILYRLGYSAPNEPAKNTVRGVLRGLESDSLEVAVAAAEVAGIIGWADFIEPLRALRTNTEPGRLRRAAGSSLDLILGR